jgi:hypothetical protein
MFVHCAFLAACLCKAAFTPNLCSPLIKKQGTNEDYVWNTPCKWASAALTRGKEPVPFEYEAGWDPDPVSTFYRRECLLPPQTALSQMWCLQACGWSLVAARIPLQQAAFLEDVCAKYRSLEKYRRKYRRKYSYTHVPNTKTILKYVKMFRANTNIY